MSISTSVALAFNPACTRAFAIGEVETNNKILVIACDLGWLPQPIKASVLVELERLYPGEFSLGNVVISGSHTHSGPGGYDSAFLYNFIVGGYVEQNEKAIVAGIVEAAVLALTNMAPGYVSVNSGTLSDVTQNRSRPQYLANPKQEREKYAQTTDTTMVVLTLSDLEGNPVGHINWFAVHSTSMKRTGVLISSDNKGYAQVELEKQLGRTSPLLTKAPVAAFVPANGGDASSNYAGPDYQLPGEMKGNSLYKIPNNDYYRSFQDSTMYMGKAQADKAFELHQSASRLSGKIDWRHTHVDMSDTVVSPEFGNGEERRTCTAALGYSFAAGTTDGISNVPGFYQGQTESVPFWDTISRIVHGNLTEEIKQCHAPKPILLAVGAPRWNIPMTPPIVPLQIITIGRFALIAFPGEIATMAGRRLRETVLSRVSEMGVDTVALHAYANAFAGHYTVTYEEYQLQWYEGGQTSFGPWQLAAFQQEYARIADDLVAGVPSEPGPEPLTFQRVENPLNTWPADEAPSGLSFGAVELEPRLAYRPGMTVDVRFWGAHPRNNLRTMDSFIFVEKLGSGSENATVVGYDWDWDTHFHWRRVNDTLSLIIVQWFIPSDAEFGQYQIRYKGDAKAADNSVFPIEGVSRVFSVSATAPDEPDSDQTPNDIEFAHLAEPELTVKEMGDSWTEMFVSLLTKAAEHYLGKEEAHNF
eukprot:TRINITY_DN6549_c0_g1_i1.p1 TRINITY_DN6549_c0_g1~~TRINITY_DN6549_c0_g1_i1.p1  ORF type:complete len:700 (-),score=184.89 TRINITY_DN6549_c0_g1_i1:42-2141(-)